MTINSGYYIKSKMCFGTACVLAYCFMSLMFYNMFSLTVVIIFGEQFMISICR